MSTYARPFADHLAAASDEQLDHLLRVRGVRADPGWQDFFDAAEALLEPSSIQRVLPALTAPEAAALLRADAGGDAGAQRDILSSWGLLQPDGAPWPPVSEAVRGRPVPDTGDGADVRPSSPAAAAPAAERAFTTVARLADLLLLARDAPFALLAGGALSAAEKRQLVDAGVPVEGIDALVDLAHVAGLTAAAERRLAVTAQGESWLRSPAAERWAHLATAFRDALPRGLRSADDGWIAPTAWDDAHPWDPAWPQRSAALHDLARLLGLIADDGTEPEWATPLRTGADARGSATALAALLPTEVDRIFLQNDLTAIAPGPLAPALDVRLRTIAARESAAQASSYRFSEESLTRGLILGETEQSILDFLDGISLTGIPQPLSYLVTRSAARHGLVRVSTDAETERTRVESSDVHLLQAIAVDQVLAPIGLVRHTDSLTTNVARDTVYWALVDARYPATLIGPDGAALLGDRRRAGASSPDPAPAADYAALIARLREHRGPDADAAWLGRELEAAVRARAVLRVTVGMPDGSTRDLLLEATGLGGGRLRGRDRAADVERTLPVSSIRSAAVVEA